MAAGGALMLAAVFDGFLVRILKSKEFGQHNPKVFVLHARAAIMTACVTILALVLTVTLHPLVFCAVPIAISIFASRTLAHFHRHD